MKDTQANTTCISLKLKNSYTLDNFLVEAPIHRRESARIGSTSPLDEFKQKSSADLKDCKFHWTEFPDDLILFVEEHFRQEAVAPPKEIHDKIMRMISEESETARIQLIKKINTTADAYQSLRKEDKIQIEHVFPNSSILAEPLKHLKNKLSVWNFFQANPLKNVSSQNVIFEEKVKGLQATSVGLPILSDSKAGKSCILRSYQEERMLSLKAADRQIAKEFFQIVKEVSVLYLSVDSNDSVARITRILKSYVRQQFKQARKAVNRLFSYVTVQLQSYWKPLSAFPITVYSFYPLKVIPCDGKEEDDLVVFCTELFKKFLLTIKEFLSCTLRKWSYY